jgi:hypothetical protein
MVENSEDVDGEEEAYLVMSPNHVKNIAMPDTIWAKIGDDKKLEILRWDIIEIYARDYDSSIHNRTQTHVICKLLTLVRDQTRKESEQAK